MKKVLTFIPTRVHKMRKVVKLYTHVVSYLVKKVVNESLTKTCLEKHTETYEKILKDLFLKEHLNDIKRSSVGKV